MVEIFSGCLSAHLIVCDTKMVSPASISVALGCVYYAWDVCIMRACCVLDLYVR